MTDPDGDQIRCRFAFGEETSELVARNRDVRGEMVTDFPSITLDEETCTVTYDGNLDNICTGEFSQELGKNILYRLGCHRSDPTFD